MCRTHDACAQRTVQTGNCAILYPSVDKAPGARRGGVRRLGFIHALALSVVTTSGSRTVMLGGVVQMGCTLVDAKEARIPGHTR